MFSLVSVRLTFKLLHIAHAYKRRAQSQPFADGYYTILALDILDATGLELI